MNPLNSRGDVSAGACTDPVILVIPPTRNAAAATSVSVVAGKHSARFTVREA
jgi:hypothetical protein